MLNIQQSSARANKQLARDQLEVQAMFGFPIKDIIIRKEITEEARVVLKDNQGTSVVEASDQEPRTISHCPYKIGDKLIITFKQGTVPIEKYHIKE